MSIYNIKNSITTSNKIIHVSAIKKTKPTFIVSDTGGFYYSKSFRYPTTAQYGSQLSKDILMNNFRVR